MQNIYRPITQGKTHRATAEAIYDYLATHPQDIPGNVNDVHSVTFRLDDTDAAVRVSELTATQYDAFPAVATDNHVEQGWSPIWGDSIGLGVILSDDLRVGVHRDRTIQRLALVVRRTLRYSKQTSRRNGQAVMA